MSESDLTKYARWLCWAHDYKARRMVLRDYQRNLNEHDASQLQRVFDEQEKLWNAKTELQRDQYRNHQRGFARHALVADKDAA